MRYLGRKFDLDGKTEEDRVQVDIMLDNAMDFRNAFVGLCYNSNFHSMKAAYVKNLEATLEKFSKYLGNRPFFAANYLTFPDFHMYEMLYGHYHLAPQAFKKFPNLVLFIERFEKLPRIAEYLNREKRSMNLAMAKFGMSKL